MPNPPPPKANEGGPDAGAVTGAAGVAPNVPKLPNAGAAAVGVVAGVERNGLMLLGGAAAALGKKFGILGVEEGRLEANGNPAVGAAAVLRGLAGAVGVVVDARLKELNAGAVAVEAAGGAPKLKIGRPEGVADVPAVAAGVAGAPKLKDGVVGAVVVPDPPAVGVTAATPPSPVSRALADVDPESATVVRLETGSVLARAPAADDVDPRVVPEASSLSRKPPLAAVEEGVIAGETVPVVDVLGRVPAAAPLGCVLAAGTAPPKKLNTGPGLAADPAVAAGPVVEGAVEGCDVGLLPATPEAPSVKDPLLDCDDGTSGLNANDGTVVGLRTTKRAHDDKRCQKAVERFLMVDANCQVSSIPGGLRQHQMNGPYAITKTWNV